MILQWSVYQSDITYTTINSDIIIEKIIKWSTEQPLM